jgi:hypothetical protein
MKRTWREGLDSSHFGPDPDIGRNAVCSNADVVAMIAWGCGRRTYRVREPIGRSYLRVVLARRSIRNLLMVQGRRLGDCLALALLDHLTHNNSCNLSFFEQNS